MSEIAVKSPYRTSAGKPWLRNSWVVYLDILGFAERVKTATEAGNASEVLNGLMAAIAEAKVDLIIDHEEYTKYGIKEAPYAVKMFTDNVVLGFPIRDDGESEFGKMIQIVGLWQYTLTKHGFFVRGGVTVGKVYMDEDIAFGKGLIDAYEAETKLARDPRVVLSQSAMDLVHHHLAYYSHVGTAPHNTSLLVDADGQLFVNYLYFPIDGCEGLPEEFKAEVQQHRDLVLKRLQEHAAAPPIWSKYAWAAAYHNHFCAHFNGLEEMTIPPESLGTVPRFLAQVYTRKGARMLRGDVEVATFRGLNQWEIETEPD